MARLYLIRHAQSANNAIWDGSDFHVERHADPEITDTGHAQARVLAEHLAHPESEPRQHPFAPSDALHHGLTHVYCSLMTRSILTAEYIARACDLPLEAMPDTFEKYGVYEFDDKRERQGLPGQDRTYFEHRFPDLKLPEDLNEDGWWNRPAEDETSFLWRMRDVVERFRQRMHGSDETVALVAHGDFLDQFINDLMGVDRHRHNYDAHWSANWTFHNTSVSRVDFVDGAHNVVYLNKIDHLTPELVTW